MVIQIFWDKMRVKNVTKTVVCACILEIFKDTKSLAIMLTLFDMVSFGEHGEGRFSSPPITQSFRKVSI